MTPSALAAIVLVVLVAALGGLLRRMSSPAQTGAPSSPAAPAPQPPPEDEGAEAEEPGEEDATIAITSDGWAFVPLPDRDRVRLVPPRQPPGPDATAGRQTPDQLVRGDLIAARVRRGAPDHDPWRLEGLGRDHEYRAWRFETEEAARAALLLVERGVVRAPREQDGATVTISDADFDDARRAEEEIEAELATMPDVSTDDEGARPGPIA